MTDSKRVSSCQDDSGSGSSSDNQLEALSSDIDKIRLQDREIGELFIKGKPPRQRPNGSNCQDKTKEKLKEVLLQRQPIDCTVDIKNLETPLHRFLSAPEIHLKSSCELVKQLNNILTEVGKRGFLFVYVNMPNKYGRTPLSLCLKMDCLVELIPLLIRCGAQLHHLCGDLNERCNHLHYAMLKASPRVINATLDEVFRQDPFGADGMYALNREHLTPKASLQARVQQDDIEPQLKSELCGILDRIRGYPPVDGVSLPI